MQYHLKNSSNCNIYSVKVSQFDELTSVWPWFGIKPCQIFFYNFFQFFFVLPRWQLRCLGCNCTKEWLKSWFTLPSQSFHKFTSFLIRFAESAMSQMLNLSALNKSRSENELDYKKKKIFLFQWFDPFFLRIKVDEFLDFFDDMIFSVLSFSCRSSLLKILRIVNSKEKDNTPLVQSIQAVALAVFDVC